MTIRVVQWATGSVGAAQLREVIDRPDLELVGLFVYGPAKVGVDAGELVGRAPTGVLATNDSGGDPRTRRRRRTPRGEQGVPGEHATPTTSLRCSSRARTSSPRRRTTTCRPSAPTPTIASVDACAEAGTRFHAAGEHPGLHVRTPRHVGHRAVAARRQDHGAGVRRLLRRSRARRCSSTSWAWGSSPKTSRSTRRCSARFRCSTSRRSAATADVLGLRARRDPATRSRPATVDHDVEVACGTLPAGSVVGQIISWTATSDGEPVLVAEEYWTVTGDIPEWDLGPRRPVPRAGHRRRIASAACRADDRQRPDGDLAGTSRVANSRWR